MSPVKLILVFTILLWQFMNGATLKCYVCNSVNDAKCLRPELLTCTQFTVQPPLLWLRFTSSAEHNITQMRQHTPSDGFKCIVYRDNFRVSRYCMYKDVEFCRHHGNGHCMECSEDGCNGVNVNEPFPYETMRYALTVSVLLAFLF